MRERITERPSHRWKDNERILKKWDVGVWTESSWIRIETVGEHLYIRKCTLGFNKLWGIS
jgi:hypothetical protein